MVWRNGVASVLYDVCGVSGTIPAACWRLFNSSIPVLTCESVSSAAVAHTQLGARVPGGGASWACRGIHAVALAPRCAPPRPFPSRRADVRSRVRPRPLSSARSCGEEEDGAACSSVPSEKQRPSLLPISVRTAPLSPSARLRARALERPVGEWARACSAPPWSTAGTRPSRSKTTIPPPSSARSSSSRRRRARPRRGGRTRWTAAACRADRWARTATERTRRRRRVATAPTRWWQWPGSTS